MSQSVYAEFGVSSNAITGSVEDLNEHQKSMLEQDVAVRDGDDAITFKQLEAENEEATEEDENVDDEESETDGEQPEFIELGDAPKELTESVTALDENEAAFDDMVSSAVEAGKVTADEITAIKAEYAKDGKLSDASYAKLQEAGYTKRFVDSFVRGQEALVEQYVQSVMEYAGGEAQFQAIYNHLEVSNPDAAESLISALENRDLSTVKAIVNLAGASRAKTFGKPAARSIAKRAVPAAPVRTKQSGFESQAEMIAAMSDPRYRHDSKFRAEVERKMMYSQF